MNKRLKIGLDIDDCIAGFSIGYVERFGKFPKVDWAITRNVNNILIKEKSHRIWSGFIYLSNKNKNVLYNSLNFYYFFPLLTNSAIFIGPSIMSIFLWKSKKEN